MPLRIGNFSVCCYHDCTNAAAIHAELKRRHIDAAVVDHTFLISPLHLAVALFRVEASADLVASRAPSTLSLPFAGAPSPSLASTETSPSLPLRPQQQPARRVSNSRQIFAALSLSHNLDRILQVLPPGPQTTSVVIIYRRCSSARAATSAPFPEDVGGGTASSPPEQDGEVLDAAIHTCVQMTNSTAQAHEFAPITEPFWTGAAFAFADVSKVTLFYGISEAMLLAAQRSMTRSDVRRLCVGVQSQAEQARVLRWHALEVCVTTLLSACTA
ncbi:hypothetical protein LSCM1_05136 [Leishmania martiniquensis]|uniref:Uncharacterized protein n=1 Tax=Leishmania martiniquensis TaxID=1580590 RepID=A0A836GRX0_9TRYP|nr:hypothetical protein LSCM1_05136 [Leishmania martiniquensis]